MPWPKECKRFVDWSYYQNLGYPAHEPFDVDAFCENHPEVDGAVIRFVWPSLVKDQHYDHYYDGFTRNEKMVMGYGWPNPYKTVKQVVEKWKEAMGDRVPKAIFGDWEEVSTFEGKTNAQLTSHMCSLNEEKHQRLPDVVHGEYSRAGWLDGRINASDEIRGYNWWLAHWIYPPPDFSNQARSFSEVDRMLPIDNNFTPYRGRVIKIPVKSVKGWQISSRLLIVPRGTSDGDYFLDSFLAPIFDDVPVPPPQDEPEPVEIVYKKGNIDLTVTET